MCVKGVLRLCHCKEKNMCQSIDNVVDAAYAILKREDNNTIYKREDSKAKSDN